ncbi:hypothetical protein [Okeania sp. SIO2C2]|nr:hypothetical protein [Okeania sp. SIO2C2]
MVQFVFGDRLWLESVQLRWCRRRSLTRWTYTQSMGLENTKPL